MRVAYHREGLALTHAREGTARSNFGGTVEARLPFGLSEADNERGTPPADGVTLRLDPVRGHDAPTGPSTVVAALRAGTGEGRLDPARGNDDGDWWPRAPTEENQATAAGSGQHLEQMSGQTGKEPVEGLRDTRQETADALPRDARGGGPTSMPPTRRHATALDSGGWRWRHWLSRPRAPAASSAYPMAWMGGSHYGAAVGALGTGHATVGSGRSARALVSRRSRGRHSGAGDGGRCVGSTVRSDVLLRNATGTLALRAECRSGRLRTCRPGTGHGGGLAQPGREGAGFSVRRRDVLRRGGRYPGRRHRHGLPTTSIRAICFCW